MVKIKSAIKDNPKLEQSILSDGRISLYLEYYLGRESKPVLDEYDNPVLYDSGKMKGRPKIKVTHKRSKESLNLYLIQNPRTPIERTQNKQTLELARKIRAEREQQLLEQGKGYRLKRHDINFIDYFQTYIDNYTKSDVRMVKIALQRFKDFCKDTKEYNIFQTSIKPQQITKDMMADYVDYLKSRSVGCGANSIYQRFKKVIIYAIDHDIMVKNPCKGIVCEADEETLRKEILSPEEEEALINTHYDNENPNIRRAFILCLYCGIRFCDVKDLQYKNVDYQNRWLHFEQNKTKGHSKRSGVDIPLSDELIEFIGQPKDGETRDSLIFPLPSYECCLKALGRWVKRAGITKHISWHCARHSFAVNILNNGANIKTVASLLGHSGLRHTEKYTRAVDSLKKAAIESLPKLKI